MANLTLNLQKSEQTLKLCLQKKGVLTPPAIDLAMLVDVSGSFEDEHESGITNDLMTRLVPWGMTFDPDRKLDVFTFSNGSGNVDDVGPITETNYQGFVKNKIIRRVAGWCGGTDYSYVLEKALDSFGWTSKPASTSGGFFGKLFGKTAPVAQAQRPAVAIMITDGENSDKGRTRQLLKESQERGDKVYFIFMGVSSNPSNFRFIEDLGREFPNVGYVPVTNLKAFVNSSDEELNEKLISDEFVAWLKN